MKNRIIKQLVVNAMFIALLVVSSFISIPVNQVPYTLQTLVVFLLLLLMNYKNNIIIFMIYLVMGLIGLPVFSGFSSGVTPTLGFILGFIISPFIYLILNKIIKIKNINLKNFINLFINMIIINLIATIFYMLYMDIDFIASLLICVVPYILVEILKIVIAIIISNRVKFLFESKYVNMYKIIDFPTLPSTNKYLKENYHLYDEYTVVTTNNQTNGKGRMTRVWNSSSDDLTFSILLKPKFDSSKISLISLIIGASLCNVISKYQKALIKWPNDIIINDKKIAGILVEGISSDKVDAIIVGVGINVNSCEFPNDLIMKASSLKLESKKDINKNQLLTEILDEFLRLYNLFINNDYEFLNIVKENNYLKNKKVFINEKEVIVLDINDKGNLLVLDNDIVKELYYGEVTLNKIYKG